MLVVTLEWDDACGAEVRVLGGIAGTTMIFILPTGSMEA
jgi:hypothetical protein